MADDRSKDCTISQLGLSDHAKPCSGETARLYYVDRPCPRCDCLLARAFNHPYNENRLVAGNVVQWDIPHSQMTFKGFKPDQAKFDGFREISYTNPKKDLDEEQPLSPKGGRTMPLKEIKNQRSLSTATDDSISSQNDLRPRGLQIRPAVPPSSEYRVRIAAPVPFQSHPSDVFGDNY